MNPTDLTTDSKSSHHSDRDMPVAAKPQGPAIGILKRLGRTLKRLDTATRPLFEHPVLKHPLVYGLILMIIGGYLLKSWEQDRANRIADHSKIAERERSIRELKREKSIDFVHDVAGDLNQMVSNFYGWIRSPNYPPAREAHEKASNSLYFKRFSNKMRSDTYFKPIGIDFHAEYKSLMIESTRTRSILYALPKSGVSTATLALSSQAQRLFDAWKVDDPTLQLDKADNNNSDINETISEWKKFAKCDEDAAINPRRNDDPPDICTDELTQSCPWTIESTNDEYSFLYGNIISLANLYYYRSQFILSRALQTSLKLY